MAQQVIPRRVPGVVVDQAGDDRFVFNPADDMLHALNGPASRVLDACDGERTPAMITDELAAHGMTEDAVVLGLCELRDAGVITFEPTIGTPSRRRLLYTLGTAVAAVAAIPVVESMIASQTEPLAKENR